MRRREHYALVCTKRDERVVGVLVSGEVAKGEECAARAMLRRDPQKTQERMRVGGKNVCRRGDAACLKRTKSITAGTSGCTSAKRK